MKLFDKLGKIISKIDTPLWLEILFFIILILRIPSFFEPFYYGDEMIYLTLGNGIKQGIPLYLGLHDNKPPLIYALAAVAGNVFWFKVLLALFNFIAIYFFWKITRALTPTNANFQKISTVVFAIFSTIPVFEGNIANAENFMAVFTFLAVLYVLSGEKDIKRFFIAGVFISMASLFKIVAAFDIIAILFFVFISNIKNIKLFFKKSIVISLGFTIPIFLSFVFFYFNGALKEYIDAAFLQNIGYVSSWRPNDISKPFIEKNLPLIIRFCIMLSGYVVLFFYRKKISKTFIFTGAWMLSSLFAATLSERPYPHYLLQVLPSISIFTGILLSYKNIEQSLTVIPLTISFLVPFYFKFWYYPVSKYYLNFLNFAVKKTNINQYFGGFSKNIERNYKIAEFISISTLSTDRIFIWSNDSPAIYSLSRRLPPTKFVADYHFIDFSNKDDVLNNLKNSKPKLIVITPNSFEFPELTEFVKANYFLIENIDSAEIWLKH